MHFTNADIIYARAKNTCPDRTIIVLIIKSSSGYVKNLKNKRVAIHEPLSFYKRGSCKIMYLFCK